MSNAVSDVLSAQDIRKLAFKENAFILVDNSNIWIQGKKTCGELQQLREENPNWRINYGKLIRLMVEYTGLPASTDQEIVQSVAYGRLFGSIPPPDDTIWKVFREHLDVDLSGRSRFSGKEKQVDAKFVDLAARDSQSLLIMKESGMPSAYDSRVYCLAAGDGDYHHTVKQILECGLRVFLFSWRNGLGQTYSSLREMHPHLMTIVELDDYIFAIGFEQTVVNADEHPIPADRSFFIVRPTGLSLKRMEKFQIITQSVHDELRQLHRVPSCLCVGVDGSAGVVAVLVKCQLTVAELSTCVVNIRALYEKEKFPASCVCSYPEYRSQASGSSDGSPAVPEFNRYSILMDEDDYELHQKPDDPTDFAETQQSTEADQFVLFNHRRPASYVSLTRCKHREFCSRASKCTFFHSDLERQLFCQYLMKAPYTMRKMKLCSTSRCTRGRACHFRHPEEPIFCTRCAQYPCVGAVCNDEYEREALVVQVVINDLQNKGYIAK